MKGTFTCFPFKKSGQLVYIYSNPRRSDNTYKSLFCNIRIIQTDLVLRKSNPRPNAPAEQVPENEKHGYIKIDGEDITALDLDVLRRNLSVIPQFNLVMSGTLRYNIDPNFEISDADIIDSLKRFEVYYLLSDSNQTETDEAAEIENSTFFKKKDFTKLTVHSSYVVIYIDIDIDIYRDMVILIYSLSNLSR